MATWAKPNLNELEERFSPLSPYQLNRRRRKARVGAKTGGNGAHEESATQFLDSSATGDLNGHADSPGSSFGSPIAARQGTTKLSPKRSAGGATAHSLDTKKLLATSSWVSCAEELELLKTPEDLWREKLQLHRVLLHSVYKIWQSKERDLDAAAERYGLASREHFLRNNQVHALGLEKTDPDFVQAWIDEAEERSEEASRALAIAEQQRKHWFGQWRQLDNCQKEWVGFRAACCNASTRPIAVPVHCNHRLCPLCASHRSQRARKRILQMFTRVSNPAVITLTIPNTAGIDKEDFREFRVRLGKFLKMHERIIGGVYSLETTYSRKVPGRPFHLHAHVLVDLSDPLPESSEKTKVAGTRMMVFNSLKWRMEFEWTRLWVARWGKSPAKNAQRASLWADEQAFRQWLEETRANVLKERDWKRGGYRDLKLSDAERERRTAWNAANRRSVDIRRVTSEVGAAAEVLKYITKVAGFAHIPEAIEPFMNAVRGARMIQTFGSWYGLQLEGDANEHDWSELTCACGCNEWKRIGVFHRDDVQMRADGRWELKPGFNDRSDPTIPRAKIPYFRDRELRDDERGRVFDVARAHREAELDDFDFVPKQQYLN